MSKLKNRRASHANSPHSIIPAVIACVTLLVTSVAGSLARFERTYTPQGPAHLTLTNMNGDISVVTWDKKTIVVRANIAPSVTIDDQVSGNDISVSVKHKVPKGRADFDISVPAGTSISLENVLGKIDIRGVSGHISVNSFDSDVRLVDVSGPSVDVKVTSGNVFYDGQLRENGSYSLQSVKGDIDVSLPAGRSFNLIARAFSENISLGDFLSSFSAAKKGPKGMTGSYLSGGPRLTLTTYNGRILLHRK